MSIMQLKNIAWDWRKGTFWWAFDVIWHFLSMKSNRWQYWQRNFCPVWEKSSHLLFLKFIEASANWLKWCFFKPPVQTHWQCNTWTCFPIEPHSFLYDKNNSQVRVISKTEQPKHWRMCNRMCHGEGEPHQTEKLRQFKRWNKKNLLQKILCLTYRQSHCQRSKCWQIVALLHSSAWLYRLLSNRIVVHVLA